MSIAKILIGSTAVVVLAGCGGSSATSSQSAATFTSPSASGSSGASSSSSIGSSSGGGSLAKADFVTQMNAVCKDTDTKLQALPQPTGLTDYPTVITNLTGTVKQIQTYLTQLDPLVPKSADAAELQSKWVIPEKADLAKLSAAARTVIIDAQTKNDEKLQADSAGLSQSGANSATIAAYLTSYGLTDCASLEDS